MWFLDIRDELELALTPYSIFYFFLSHHQQRKLSKILNVFESIQISATQ